MLEKTEPDVTGAPEQTQWANNVLLLGPRKIALIGTSPTGKCGPFDDPAYEIWGVSARGPYVTRANRWFELHRLDGEPPDWAASWRTEMKRFTKDIGVVLMMYPEKDLAPVVESYPVSKITARFGTYFMTSTFSWMMALAIDEMRPLGPDGFARAFANGDEIMIRGVEMEYGGEYRQQRSGFRHFISLAQSLGIRVDRDVSGGLVYEPVPYPFWQDDPHLNKLERRNTDCVAKTKDISKSLHMTGILLAQNRAALLEIESAEAASYDKEARRTILKSEIEALEQSADTLSRQIIAFEAVDGEQKWHLDYLRST
jgi:hypothetical protein